MSNQLTSLSLSTRKEWLRDAITERKFGDDNNRFLVQHQRAEPIDELTEEIEETKFDGKNSDPRQDCQGVLHPSKSVDPSFE